MASLADQLLTHDVRPVVIDACCDLIQREVGTKRGLSGIAVKTGFGVVTRVKPGFVREVVTKLLPEFVTALEPMYREAADSASDGDLGARFIRHVLEHRGRAAEALLGVTDSRIRGARSPLPQAYKKLRSSARENVEGALPGLLEVLRPHLA